MFLSKWTNRTQIQAILNGSLSCDRLTYVPKNSFKNPFWLCIMMIKNNFTPILTLFHHVLQYFLLFDCFFWYFFAWWFVSIVFGIFFCLLACLFRKDVYNQYRILDVNTLTIHFTLSTEIEIYSMVIISTPSVEHIHCVHAIDS